MPTNKEVVIVGAGVGGLATAARLSSRGFKVKVLEKLSLPGGRNNLLLDKGFKFDMGPSFVMMPDFFEEVFSYCKENIKEYLDLKVLDVNYKIFFPGNKTLTVYKDTQATKEELEKFEINSAAQYDNFLYETERIYKLLKPLLYKCFTPSSLLDFRYWPLLFKIKPFESYWQLARKYFKSKELCFAFTFEAMFMGVSPYAAPAFYSIISYTDHKDKIRHPMGGMYQIPIALEKLAKKYTAQFFYDCEVKSIRKRNGRFMVQSDNCNFDADNVVVNADYAFAQEKLLGRKLPDFEYSCSVYLIYLGLKKKVSGLEHHNLFFSKDLQKNLKDIFITGSLPDDPSFYVHVPTVTDSSLAEKDKEIFYILIPVANLKKSKYNLKEKEEILRESVFKKIDSLLGIKLQELIEVEHRFYPEDFIGRYNINFGATFGLAHNLMQSAFFRPANLDRKMQGLYYVGASTQPGGGLPVVIAGSRIVADLISGNKAKFGRA